MLEDTVHVSRVSSSSVRDEQRVDVALWVPTGGGEKQTKRKCVSETWYNGYSFFLLFISLLVTLQKVCVLIVWRVYIPFPRP